MSNLISTILVGFFTKFLNHLITRTSIKQELHNISRNNFPEKLQNNENFQLPTNTTSTYICVTQIN